MKTINAIGYICERCTYSWTPRKQNVKPRTCPKCKSPYWETPRKIKGDIND